MSAPTTRSFPDNARAALDDAVMRGALAALQRNARAAWPGLHARLPEFDALRDAAVEIKDHTLAHLDFYLERFEAAVRCAGGEIHWCRDDREARAAVLAICRAADARTVAKGKSMISEEIGLNPFLAANGIEPVETDLGEYIVQLRDEAPSHIIMPAIHLTKGQIADTFRTHHDGLDPARSLDEPAEILDEARLRLRARFIAADVGITGANFLIAETGSTVIVTNEGNGDLSQTLPGVHIVLASIEKVVPSLADAMTLIRVLARSATAQEMTSYVTLSTGRRRDDDTDGPARFHVVLLDNGRSELLGGPFAEILRCIRCGACQTACPVYGAVGGHAYGWVYGGPIGAVLTPALIGIDAAHHLPKASTLCGQCEAVCPMRIPLPALMRRWRERAYDQRVTAARRRWGLRLWAFCARRPALYRLVAGLAATTLRLLAAGRGRVRRLPLAGGWTASRDLPAPEPGGGFVAQWKRGVR